MRSLPIPPEVEAALRARNPYRIVWENAEAHRRFEDVAPPAREVAQRLLDALPKFPPRHDDFDILDIRAGLAGTGYKVMVGTGTHIRVTVTAQYREAQQVVSIQEFQAHPRTAERLKSGDKPSKGA
ncbi:MAG: hypothetical protein ACREKE_01220 [bacterium]